MPNLTISRVHQLYDNPGANYWATRTFSFILGARETEFRWPIFCTPRSHNAPY